ncbi:MAG: hypothetical protein WCK39_07245 [Methanomassiliicoccales archaeon]
MSIRRCADCDRGMLCHFSSDTSATVYVNSSRVDVAEMRRRIEALGIRTLACSVGDEAHTVDRHLF